MQFTDFGALFENVDHQCRRSDQEGLDLLFLRVVSTDRGDEGSGRDSILLDEGVARGGARHAHVTFAKGGWKILRRLQPHAPLPGSSRRETFSSGMVGVEEHDAL